MYAVWSMCLCVCEHVHTQPCPWRPEEGTGFSGAGITQSCELPHMGAGTQSVCWKNKQQSLSLSHHSGFIYVCMYVYKMYMLVQFLVGSSCTKLTFSQTKRQHTIPPPALFFIFWVQEMQALQKHWTCEATEGSSEEFNLTQRGYILITCSLFPLTSQPSSSTQVLV